MKAPKSVKGRKGGGTRVKVDEGELSKRIDRLKLLGRHTAPIRKMLTDLKKTAGKDREQYSAEHEKVQRMLEDEWNEWLKERSAYQVRILELAISELEEDGRSLQTFRRKLTNISKKMKDPSKIQKRLTEVVAELESQFENNPRLIGHEAYNSFMKAMTILEKAALTEMDLTKQKKYFKRLIKFLEKGDLKNTLIYSNLLYTDLSSGITEDLAKDRFKNIEKEVNHLMETMEEFRKYGLEQENMEKELKKLRKGLEPSRFNEVQSTLNRLTKNISRTEKEYFRRKANVNFIEVSDLIDEYGSLIDLKDHEKQLSELRENITTTSPKKLLDASEKLLSGIKDVIHENFEPQIREKMEVLDHDLSSASDLPKKQRKRIVELRDMARNALENKDITEAMEYLSLAESMFNQAEDERTFEVARKRYQDLLTGMEDLIREDIDVSDVKSEVERIESLWLDEDLQMDTVLNEVRSAENLLREKFVERRTMRFNDERKLITGALESMDIDPTAKESLRKEIEEMEQLLSSMEDDEYEKRMGAIRSNLESVMSGYLKDHYNDWVTRIDSSVEKLGLDEEVVSGIKVRLEEAGNLYKDEDFLGTGTILKDLSDQVREMEERKEIQEAEALLNSAEFLFEEARRSGVDVSEQEEMLQQAKEMLARGDIQGSRDIASRVESSVKSIWMESRKNHLKEDLDGLRNVFAESSELGLDIDEASGLLDEAESFFEKEMYEEVTERVEQARETIEQKRRDYFSTGTMESISELKSDIEKMRDLGINTVEAETLLVEAERLFMEEDYERSYSMTLDIRDHLNRSKRAYLQQEVPKKMDEVAHHVGKLEVMGLDTELARSYLDEASRSREENNLESTVENLRKAENVSDEIYRSHISLTIPETLVDVTKQIEHAEDEGFELDDLKSLLGEAEEMFNNEQYDEALETIEKLKGDFEERREEFYRNQYLENMDQVEEMIGRAQGMDREVELSRENINMARDAFEMGDFEKSHRLIDRVMKFLEESFENRETSKRKEVVQTYMDEVKTLISVAEAENVDVEEEKKMFAIAGDLFMKEEYDQAEHVLEGIKLGLQDKRVQMKKRLIESSIQTTEILLDNMSEMGVDTSFERGLIGEMKEALRKGDLDLCDDINSRLQEALHKNQGPYMVQKIQRNLSSLRGSMVEASTKGIDISKVQAHLSRATELFERGDVQGAQSEIAVGKEALGDAFNRHREEQYGQVYDELQGMMVQLMKMGIPTDDEEELVNLAKSVLEEGRIEEAASFIETALIGASAKLNSFQSTTAEGYMHQIESYLEELKASEVDVSDLEKIYEEGVALHSRGEDEKAVAKFSSILELGEEIRTMREVEHLRETLYRLEGLYSDLRAVGMKKNKKMEKTFENARAVLKKDTLDTSKLSALLDKIDGLISAKAEPFREALTKKHIADARSGLVEIGKKGEDTEELKKSIRKAAELLRSGDLVSADAEAVKVLDTIERFKLKETEDILKDEISSVRQMLTRLKTLGSNVLDAESLLSRAEAALLEGKVGDAEDLVHQVRDSVKEIVRRNMRETALETIEFVDAMIHYLMDNFSGLSTKLVPAENLLDEARNLFKDKKFKASKNKAEEARAEVEKLDIANIKQFFYVFRSSQATEMSRNVEIGISELKAKGVDVSKVKLLYDKAQEHFEKDEFDRGRQMLTLARIMLAEIDKQSLRDNAFDELNNAHVEILTSKRQGGNVTQAYRIYNKAKEAFQMREFKKAILLSKKARYQLKKVD